MESAFAATLRNLSLLQRDQLSKTAKMLISCWKFLDLADEIAGVGAVSSSNQVLENEQLLKVIKLELKNLRTVCCHKVFSMLTAALFEEFAFVLLKVLLNLSDDARQDVQLVLDDGGDELSVGDKLIGENFMGFAAKECFSQSSNNFSASHTCLISGACCRACNGKLCQTCCRDNLHGRYSCQDTSGAIQSIYGNH